MYDCRIPVNYAARNYAAGGPIVLILNTDLPSYSPSAQTPKRLAIPDPTKVSPLRQPNQYIPVCAMRAGLA
jgi:hypothetical protein